MRAKCSNPRRGLFATALLETVGVHGLCHRRHDQEVAEVEDPVRGDDVSDAREVIRHGELKGNAREDRGAVSPTATSKSRAGTKNTR